MMNRIDDPVARAALSILAFRLERIEQLLAEEELSPEMEAQLRQTMFSIQLQIQAERACAFHDPRRRAAA
jgi:hypothetical protein